MLRWGIDVSASIPEFLYTSHEPFNQNTPPPPPALRKYLLRQFSWVIESGAWLTSEIPILPSSFPTYKKARSKQMSCSTHSWLPTQWPFSLTLPSPQHPLSLGLFQVFVLLLGSGFVLWRLIVAVLPLLGKECMGCGSILANGQWGTVCPGDLWENFCLTLKWDTSMRCFPFVVVVVWFNFLFCSYGHCCVTMWHLGWWQPSCDHEAS